MDLQSLHPPSSSLPTHRHARGYAALVLEGGHEEFSADGRFRCVRGSLLIHPPWHAHGNTFGRCGARVLNMPTPAHDCFLAVIVPDPDALENLAARSPEAAGMAAMEETQDAQPVAPAPWLTRLWGLLIAEPEADIAELAIRCGVTPAHVSRAFKRWFGMGPSALRREGRLQAAIAQLRSGKSPADVAAECGFSDQPHLTRLLKRATGLTPAQLPRD